MESSDTLEFPGLFTIADRITVEQGFVILWKVHLEGKPSARSFMGNRKALCRSLGGYYWDTLTEIDVERHLRQRAVGPQTIRHDLKLLTMAYNKFKRWKKKKYVVCDVDFARVRLPEEDPCFDIERPKTSPRKRIVSPDEFSRLVEHADEDLSNLMITMLDTGMRLNDALNIEPEAYNATLDAISWVQNKTGIENMVPASRRVRRIFLQTQGKEKVFDETNLRARFETARNRAGLKDIQLGRDLRKTLYNVARRITNGPDIPRQIMGHTSNRTGDEHYHVEDRGELRPVVRRVSKVYAI